MAETQPAVSPATTSAGPNRLVWDKDGEREFTAGIDLVALYVQDSKGAYQEGVAWNGVSKVSESPEGAEANTTYANNRPYLNLVSAEKFKGTIEAYMSPEEFDACDGTLTIADAPGLKVTAQNRARFGLAYRESVGNDLEGIGASYNIHIVYNATASVSSRDHETINEDLEPTALSWDFDTIPVDIPGMKKPTAHLIVETAGLKEKTVNELMDTLYGGAAKAKLPTPAELIAILKKDKTN